MANCGYYETRNEMELSVGTSHIVDVLLQLRQDDLKWFNDNVTTHEAELMEIVSTKILAVEETFRNEVLAAKKRVVPTIQTESIGTGKRGKKQPKVIIGEKNLDSDGEVKGLKVSKKRKAPKKSEGVGVDNADKSGKSTKQKDSAFQRPNILYGKNIQVIYRLLDRKTSQSNQATLFFIDERNESKKISTSSKKKSKKKCVASFGQLKKLSKKIEIWVFRFDENNPSFHIPSGGGFPRPEMTPLTALFRDGSEGEG